MSIISMDCIKTKGILLICSLGCLSAILEIK